jgi:AcrR family transcriptional regulator
VPERNPAGESTGQDADSGLVIWDRLDRAARGPQPSLTHSSIARAAIEIADADGIDAVSMRKVAARLGAGTMSLYRYVNSREELIDLMVDEVFAEVTSEGTGRGGSGDWRADLANIARDSRRVALRHPWLSAYATARPTLGPNTLAAIERSLGTVDGIGLDMDGMLDMWMTVQAFVQGYVLAELAEREAQRRSGLTQMQWRARIAPYMRRVIESGKYPLVTRLVIEAEDYPDPDAVFERRLGYVLDGLPANRGIPPANP